MYHPGSSTAVSRQQYQYPPPESPGLKVHIYTQYRALPLPLNATPRLPPCTPKVTHMQGLGLMRRLTPEQYQYYGESLEAVMTNASEQDVDVFAQRMYVLHHLVAPRATGELPSDASEGVDMWEHASGHASDYKLMYFRGEEDLPEPSECALFPPFV